MDKLLGQSKSFRFQVTDEMFAVFDGELIHPVLSTYWLSYYFEWFSRQLIQPYFEPNQNACGAKLSIIHKSPAFCNQWVDVLVVVTEVERQIIECSLTATVENRVIAEGKTSQFFSEQSFFNDQFKPRKIQ